MHYVPSSLAWTEAGRLLLGKFFFNILALNQILLFAYFQRPKVLNVETINKQILEKSK